MSRYTFTVLTLLLSLALGASNTALAEIFYQNNYDTGNMPKYWPTPENNSKWTLAQTFPKNYGSGNHFNLNNKTSHSGVFSLRFTYQARNNFCNTCGGGTYQHIQQGHDNVGYFIADTGEDLSIIDNINTSAKDDDGPKAEIGKFIYNKDGGYSKWEILAVTKQNTKNDRLNLKLVTEGINGETTINSGDDIMISRHCGIDGLIGIKKGVNDINRRSDCNNVIMWFGLVEPLPAGSTLYRRQYLKAEVTSPRVRQKLHYLRPDNKGANSGEVVIFADSTVGPLYPELAGLNKHCDSSGLPKYTIKNNFSGLEYERGIWYSVQEMYKFATPNGSGGYNTNGEYRLWFGKSGSEPAENDPTLVVTGLCLPPLVASSGTQISFWGNIQHSSHARGHWYIDDVIINDNKNGHGWNPPITQSSTNRFSTEKTVPTKN